MFLKSKLKVKSTTRITGSFYYSILLVIKMANLQESAFFGSGF
jgi:hypothetical protein